MFFDNGIKLEINKILMKTPSICKLNNILLYHSWVKKKS